MTVDLDNDTISVSGLERRNSLPVLYMTMMSRKPIEVEPPPEKPTENHNPPRSDRDKWENDMEFIFSCISLSVGLGNIWRFPFTALENGGGAFVVPYIIVLFLVGKPIYYMEMLLGQLSSRGSIKVYDLAPAMRGVGYGQMLSTISVAIYYASLMALCVRYFMASFYSTLPWATCKAEWNETCISSSLKTSVIYTNVTVHSSAELYFSKEVLKEATTINNGIGTPDLHLVLCLGFSWLVVTLIVIKGIKSSGKVSYVLAVFPYVVMILLLVRAVTLPGSLDGIIYFLNPQWEKILQPKVWYAAITQVFFSLSICFGNIIMYSSYNRFGHNIYQDVNIITAIDTFTSLLAGCIIFGILGHLAQITRSEDVGKVLQAGTGLAFISYPEAIAKLDYLPQLFSLSFFGMLFMLGIGSNIGMASSIMTVIRDKFPNLKHWTVSVGIAVVGFTVGIVYTTPGGQFILTLVDFYGASFVAFVLAIAELITFSWIYGVNRLCKDAEFMLGIKTGLYWRLCWGIIAPGLMFAILLYTLVHFEPPTYGKYTYSDGFSALGWSISALGLIQLPLWMIYAICQQKDENWLMKIKIAFAPKMDWGPLDPILNKKYQDFIDAYKTSEREKAYNLRSKLKSIIFG